MSDSVKISVLIPVFNEEETIPHLCEKVFTSLKSLKRSWEVVFIDDGSTDDSLELLKKERQKYSDKMVIVELDGNFGQHQALVAGMSAAHGEYMITLDADLQNPPSEVLKVEAEMEKGFDYVGTIRVDRNDKFWRKFLSKINNRIREAITNIKITDQGCMLRGYHRRIVNLILKSEESSVYLPALGYNFSRKPTEIEVQHDAREYGKSKYSFYRLLRLNFDIMTVYSLVPLQMFSLVGIVIAFISAGFFVLLMVRRIWMGPEAEGLFTLFSLQFFFIGVCLFGIGILGEYVGRIYSEVRRRPRFLIRQVYRPALPTKDYQPNA
jgi:undecaprenyl-phosphate 4-deoxy-4-formamido-L-arabinose transferase